MKHMRNNTVKDVKKSDKKINMLMKCNRSVMIVKKCKKKSKKW